MITAHCQRLRQSKGGGQEQEAELEERRNQQRQADVPEESKQRLWPGSTSKHASWNLHYKPGSCALHLVVFVPCSNVRCGNGAYACTRYKHVANRTSSSLEKMHLSEKLGTSIGWLPTDPFSIRVIGLESSQLYVCFVPTAHRASVRAPVHGFDLSKFKWR